MFPIITANKQKEFEQSSMGSTDTTPNICGYYGRACRQLDKEEGANRALCTHCGLKEYCTETKCETKPPNTMERIRAAIENKKARSAWDRGRKQYALELLDNLGESIEGGYFDINDIEAPRLLRSSLLNGANDWNQYSWGGCSLIYDSDIAERLCNPSELKRNKHGERRPNSQEEWLDVQARALFQAANMIFRIARREVNSQ